MLKNLLILSCWQKVGFTMRDIRVLHISNFHNIGGIENRLIDFFSEPSIGFKFFVFSPNPIINLYKQALTNLGIIFKYTAAKNWIEDLVRFVKKHRIDIAHFHRPWFQAKLTLKKAGIRGIIEHDHGASWLSTAQQIKQDKKSISVVDGVIAVSEASKCMLSKRLGYNPQDIQVIYNGVQFLRFSNHPRLPKPGGVPIISTICRLVSLKGVESLIRAIPFILVHHPHAMFWIIGDGPKRLEYINLARMLGIEDNIRFWSAQENVGNFLWVTDIFVLPSVREPFGGVLIEAGYFGKPCVATNVDGNPEIIMPGKTGLLLTPTEPFSATQEKGNSIPSWVVDGSSYQLRKPLALNPRILAEAICHLIEDPEYAQELGDNARDRVIREFNIQRYQREIFAFYNKLATSKGLI